MPYTKNEGARLHWLRHGKRGSPPLVLLHSIGTDLDIFAEAVPLLEGRFDIVRIDLRGHGGSEAATGDYSLALLARDVLSIMDEAGFGQATVCGVSLGGMVAMELALFVPGRLSGLIPACTSAAMDPAMWTERVATARESGLSPVLNGWAARHMPAQFMAANPARVARLEARFSATDPQGYSGCAAAIRDMDLIGRLALVKVPTLVIAGEQDVATPFEGHGSRIASAIPGAQVAMLPGGHLSCIECPQYFAEAVAALASGKS